MSYPGMSPEVFQNANISILACQLFIMVLSLIGLIYSIRKSKVTPVVPAATTGARL